MYRKSTEEARAWSTLFCSKGIAQWRWNMGGGGGGGGGGGVWGQGGSAAPPPRSWGRIFEYSAGLLYIRGGNSPLPLCALMCTAF